MAALECGLEPATTVPSTAMLKGLGLNKQLITAKIKIKKIKSTSRLPVKRDLEQWRSGEYKNTDEH